MNQKCEFHEKWIALKNVDWHWRQKNGGKQQHPAAAILYQAVKHGFGLGHHIHKIRMRIFFIIKVSTGNEERYYLVLNRLKFYNLDYQNVFIQVSQPSQKDSNR